MIFLFFFLWDCATIVEKVKILNKNANILCRMIRYNR